MHTNWSLQSIPNPVQIKSTLSKIHKKLTSIQSKYSWTEHQNDIFTQDLQKYTDGLELVIEQTIKAFNSKSIEELKKVEKIIQKFGSELDNSNIKILETHLSSTNHHQTPFPTTTSTSFTSLSPPPTPPAPFPDPFTYSSTQPPITHIPQINTDTLPVHHPQPIVHAPIVQQLPESQIIGRLTVFLSMGSRILKLAWRIFI